jgi:hypothetical protein
MEGLLWWPRLSPVVPVDFQDMLGGAQAPMMALLNLSVVFAALAPLAAIVLGVGGRQWAVALGAAAGGLILARLCYRAAVSQAADVGNLLRVAFDLYRFSILDQLDKNHPGDPEEERALWHELTLEILALPNTTSPPSA